MLAAYFMIYPSRISSQLMSGLLCLDRDLEMKPCPLPGSFDSVRQRSRLDPRHGME